MISMNLPRTPDFADKLAIVRQETLDPGDDLSLVFEEEKNHQGHENQVHENGNQPNQGREGQANRLLTETEKLVAQDRIDFANLVVGNQTGVSRR
jgi:hypothetical protein